MSAVWVRLDEAQRGSLPARCARTGERSITRYPNPVPDLPPVVEWATWTGLWPRRHGEAPPTVIVPLLPSRQRMATVLRRTRDTTAAVLPVALVTLMLSSGLPARLAGGLALGAVLLHLVVGVLGVLITVALRPDITGQWVLLSGAHPEFVTATEAVTTRPERPPQLAEAPAARSAARTTGEPLES